MQLPANCVIGILPGVLQAATAFAPPPCRGRLRPHADDTTGGKSPERAVDNSGISVEKCGQLGITRPVFHKPVALPAYAPCSPTVSPAFPHRVEEQSTATIPHHTCILWSPLLLSPTLGAHHLASKRGDHLSPLSPARRRLRTTGYLPRLGNDLFPSLWQTLLAELSVIDNLLRFCYDSERHGLNVPRLHC